MNIAAVVGSGRSRARFRMVLGLALLAAVMAGCDTTPILLRGTVSSASSGSKLVGVSVEVWAASEQTLVDSRSTGMDGGYEVHQSTLAEGTYRVRIGGQWQGGSSWDDADPVAVTTEAPVVLDATLPTDGSLSGRVVAPDWTPMTGTVVWAVDSSGEARASAIVDPGTGGFTLDVIAAGTYTLKLVTPPATVPLDVGGPAPTQFDVASGENEQAGVIDGTSGLPAAPIFSDVDTGNDRSCAARTDGSVWCWGLAFGAGPLSTVPLQKGSFADVTDVAVGYASACAATSGGSVWCWGSNQQGQLGAGPISDSPNPVQVGIADVGSVSVGYAHACAVKETGTVWCWGDNSLGQLGDGGWVGSNIPVQVSGISDASAVSAGSFSTCAIRAQGTVWCWGSNGQGLLGSGTGPDSPIPLQVAGFDSATSVSVGDWHACMSRWSGAVWCWGSNYDGQLGDGVTATAAYTPVQAVGISNAASVDAGTKHTCAVGSTGAASCWGDGDFGGLGRGNTVDSGVPVAVVGLAGASTVTAGTSYSCAIRSLGIVSCWGHNNSGQLGIGNYIDQLLPADISTP